MREGVDRRRIGEIIVRYVNRLDRGDRTGVGVGDAFLKPRQLVATRQLPVGFIPIGLVASCNSRPLMKASSARLPIISGLTVPTPSPWIIKAPSCSGFVLIDFQTDFEFRIGNDTGRPRISP